MSARWRPPARRTAEHYAARGLEEWRRLGNATADTAARSCIGACRAPVLAASPSRPAGGRRGLPAGLGRCR
eukprot:393797-Lingulodinium_polyedra.AAC.1